MLRLLALCFVVLPSLAAAQPVIVSAMPDKVAVTVYRDPNGSGAMNLHWLNGFALISETRNVDLPAGVSELRFERVAGGLLPQSAVVSGLDESVREKNRDAKLLSPGTLLDASLGKRVTLRRTSRATGTVTEQDAVIRAAANGVVVETASGVEVLRCDGETETLLTAQVPETLSAKPTLSIRVQSAKPYRGPVTLTYLSSGFDWRAHYVATLGADGKSFRLFAWLTIANGDETGFANAATMAIAGRLNREYAERLQPETSSISLNCWPSQRTHETPVGFPPPAPPSAPEHDAIVVTGARVAKTETLLNELPQLIAQRENLGDLKLYRISIPVSVASNSLKQVALLEQPKVKLRTIFRWRAAFDSRFDEPQVAVRTLIFGNEEREGLGIPLPAGSFTLYAVRDGQPFLVGEGVMTDRAVGEKVEVPISDSPGVRVSQRLTERSDKNFDVELVASNDQAVSVPFEAVFSDSGIMVGKSGLKKRDGEWVWESTIPANGSKTLRFRFRNPD